ncbi:mRNA interferase RelE/StbE [Nitrosospira multiformis]|uniref:mRNA interferase RelE/StbE n=1 Tax=Nitrosospira multiformis TaxID=1231 RepID=A0A1H8P821_9PROT|nr:type II toxin-antitoxin system RelE/ParE family toxin [Nitrosospira multiformis]SEO37874.1 mRNA interferase RelE/StbE [Nitrosospira multiformis]
MAWKIELYPAVERELSQLDLSAARPILVFLYERVALLDDPRSIGEPLKGSQLNEFWKYWVGNYRVIANIEDSTVRILVVRISQRREIYR